jgi:1-acyl-sn-glycerol-3-phosphate acyltransferase
MPPEAVSRPADQLPAQPAAAALPLLASVAGGPPGVAAPKPPGKIGHALLTAARAGVLFGTLGFFWVCTFLFSLTGLPLLHVAIRDPIRRRRVTQRFVSSCFGAIHGLLAFLRIYHCRWQGLKLAETAAVLVANHPSFLDFTAIAAACPTLCCVVKPLLMRNPLVGRVLRACGHVDGRSETLAGAESTFAELRQRLAEGFPVLIFPEGTRSPVGGLWAFRRGPFRLACVAGVPLRLLLLDCFPSALGKGVSIWQYPRVAPTLTLDVQADIAPAGRTPGSMRDECEQRVRERLALLAQSRQ